MKVYTLLACWALLLITGSGCMRLLERPPLYRENFSFSLNYPDLPPPRQGPLLTVRLFEAAPQFENQEFVYRLTPLRWQTDYYHVFTQPPATLVTAEVRRWLGQSGLFRAVAIPGLGSSDAWQLQGFITQIYGDFQNPEQPEAVLQMRCALLAPGRTADPVLVKSYRQRVPLRVNSPEGLVEGWNTALEFLLRELTQDLARAVRNAPAASAAPPAPSATPESATNQSPRLLPRLFQPSTNWAAPHPSTNAEQPAAEIPSPPSPTTTP